MRSSRGACAAAKLSSKELPLLEAKMDKAGTFGLSIVVMIVGAIVLGRVLGELAGPVGAIVGGFLAFLIAMGVGTYWERRKGRGGG